MAEITFDSNSKTTFNCHRRSNKGIDKEMKEVYEKMFYQSLKSTARFIKSEVDNNKDKEFKAKVHESYETRKNKCFLCNDKNPTLMCSECNFHVCKRCVNKGLTEKFGEKSMISNEISIIVNIGSFIKCPLKCQDSRIIFAYNYKKLYEDSIAALDNNQDIKKLEAFKPISSVEYNFDLNGKLDNSSLLEAYESSLQKKTYFNAKSQYYNLMRKRIKYCKEEFIKEEEDRLRTYLIVNFDFNVKLGDKKTCLLKRDLEENCFLCQMKTTKTDYLLYLPASSIKLKNKFFIIDTSTNRKLCSKNDSFHIYPYSTKNNSDIVYKLLIGEIGLQEEICININDAYCKPSVEFNIRIKNYGESSHFFYHPFPIYNTGIERIMNIEDVYNLIKVPKQEIESIVFYPVVEQ